MWEVSQTEEPVVHRRWNNSTIGWAEATNLCSQQYAIVVKMHANWQLLERLILHIYWGRPASSGTISYFTLISSSRLSFCKHSYCNYCMCLSYVCQSSNWMCKWSTTRNMATRHTHSFMAINKATAKCGTCRWLSHVDSQPLYPWFCMHCAVFTLDVNDWNTATTLSRSVICHGTQNWLTRVSGVLRDGELWAGSLCISGHLGWSQNRSDVLCGYSRWPLALQN